MGELNLEKEISDLVEWLASYGADSKGGVSRLLYDENWVKAQDALKEHFEQIGMVTKYDEVGNLFGKMEGSEFKDETVATGSHVDSVKFGGKLDGAFGILASYLAVKYLKEKFGQPKRNIEVVSIAEEEGSRFPFTFWGSKNIVGKVDASEVRDIKDQEGVNFVDAMKQAGFGYKTSDEGIPADWKQWLEIHIEQGGVLEIEKIPVGIVQHIVGQNRYTVEIKGEANHAGTTPMKYRKDAGVAAAKIITMIQEQAKDFGEPMVATVGSIEFVPGTVNVVPGQANFSIDIRHTHKDQISSFAEKMTEKMERIAEEEGCEISINLYMEEDPVPMDPSIVQTIVDQCDGQGLSYKLMHSGAGHDTQRFAPLVPSAMIFVPSRGGISHNPAEFTYPREMAEGVKVLALALHKLAY
ncbi:allantoate deiminase [Aciduricibacillus chroicocephali]|uniref:Allantoate deiminase n=1 Tax=Aciduricibacillus chroicocephali TaxID=3054939 RepID=A0ABY9KVX5_9BACI|nr:allantoate deiminase [Bacillaceae bacterium 44XB]